MLRFNIFVSAIPLILAGLFARGEPASIAQPCIALGNASAQIAPTPWQAQFHVSFTNNPADATIRVQIVDRAENADFTVVDDVGEVDTSACPINASTRFIGIATTPSALEPIIYLSHDGNADYRIYVRSKTFSEHDAAALLVGAQGDRSHVTAALL